ncbi:hypothetical protein [Shewanella chilikensis]|uniref:hypothetical protein n=1 Tax=Shewanella chilikensis TaxID=558541 RepID=UPI0039999FF7
MSWKGFTIDGNFKDLSHLESFTMETAIDGINMKLVFSFLSHCFTDEKGENRMPFKNEERYWSEDRYELSKGLPDLIRKNFLINYAVPFLNKRRNEQYHYMEVHGYAIFFDINKPQDTTNELKIKIVSAYEVDEWGKHGLPKKGPKKVSWILSRRNQGLSAL